MALSLDPATRVITVPFADLTSVTGDLYSLDTDAFRKEVMDLLASESYVWMPEAYSHNTAVTVAGTTYARTLEFINNYSVNFEFTGSAYSVRLEGSNNNVFDQENGILVPTSLVTIISTNAAGLIAAPTQFDAADRAKLDELYEDRALDASNPKTITEVTGGTEYDEDSTNISKEVRKSGLTTVITRVP